MSYLLRSGFIKKTDKDLTKNHSLDDGFYDDLILGKGYLKDKDVFYYNESISNLFKKFSADKNIIKDDVFKEDVLICCYRLFEGSMLSWIKLQSTITLSESHKMFIVDLLHTVFSLKKRSINVAQWSKILNFSDVKREQPNREPEFLDLISEIQNSQYKKSDTETIRDPFNFNLDVYNWMVSTPRRERKFIVRTDTTEVSYQRSYDSPFENFYPNSDKGIVDILITLYSIFGSRPGTNNVNRN